MEIIKSFIIKIEYVQLYKLNLYVVNENILIYLLSDKKTFCITDNNRVYTFNIEDIEKIPIVEECATPDNILPFRIDKDNVYFRNKNQKNSFLNQLKNIL